MTFCVLCFLLLTACEKREYFQGQIKDSHRAVFRFSCTCWQERERGRGRHVCLKPFFQVSQILRNSFIGWHCDKKNWEKFENDNFVCCSCTWTMCSVWVFETLRAENYHEEKISAWAFSSSIIHTQKNTPHTHTHTHIITFVLHTDTEGDFTGNKESAVKNYTGKWKDVDCVYEQRFSLYC